MDEQWAVGVEIFNEEDRQALLRLAFQYGGIAVMVSGARVFPAEGTASA